MYNDDISSNPLYLERNPPQYSIKTSTDDIDQKRRLFQQPRDLNKLVDDPSKAKKYKFIQREREPSPVGRRCFANGIREDTKFVGHNRPQIDLSKPVREPVGCQSPIKSVRRQLFEQPRKIFDDNIEERRSKQYNREGENVTRDSTIYTIPNSPRLFQNQSRDLNKTDEIQGSSPKILIDTNKPEHDIFYQIPRENRKLFEEPRDLNKLASRKKSSVSMGMPRIAEEPQEECQRKLFQVPREIMKYQDVEGSRPARKGLNRTRNPSPTFVSHDIFG